MAASWKKLVLSGSNISQLNNDAGYLTSVTAQNAFVTASVNGVALVADDSQGTLTFASSSGAGLNISGDAGTDTITFSIDSGSIDINGLSGSLSVSNGGTGQTTLSSGEVLLGNGTSGITSVTRDDIVDAGSGKVIITGGTDAILGGNVTLDIGGGIFSSSAQFDLADLTDGNGIVDFTYDGSSTAVITLDTASAHFTNGVVAGLPSGTVSGSSQIDGTAIQNNTVSFGGVSVALGGSDATPAFDLQDATNYPYSSLTGVPSGIISSSVEGDAQGQIKFNGVNVDANNLGTTDNPTFAGVTADVVRIGITANNEIDTTSGNLILDSAGGTVSIDDDVVISGDLTVNGTTTTINTDNLLVEDKFALFASGSTSATDGGIIVQSNVAGTGFALGYDSDTDRWGLQDALAHTTTTIAPKDFILTVSKSSTDPSDSFAPTYGGTGNGEGNMHVNTVTNEIWIYA